MAISIMKKLTVFAHAVDADRLARRLMRCRCVDVEPAGEDGGWLSRNSCEAERAEQEKKLERIESALVLLHRSSAKAPLVKVRTEVAYSAFCADGRRARAWQIIDRVNEIDARRAEMKSEENRAAATRAALGPWRGYDLPLSLTGTRHTRVVQGSFPVSGDWEYIRDSLASDGVYCELVGRDERALYAALVYCRRDEETLGRRLSELGFLRASFKDNGGVPRAELEVAALAQKSLAAERMALDDEMSKLAAETELVEILSDIERTTLTAIDTRARMARTDNCVMLSGWVPTSAEKKVAGVLERFDCAYALDEPDEDDDVPVLLQNNRFAENFEWVLGMYAYPKYGTYDPTFIMSIFYFIIFGVMFADVGYGALLVLACFGGVALLKPKPGMKRFLLMFGICGISSIIWGVILGAYFGDLPRAFATNMLGISPPEKVALWFDPLEDPMTFLILSLAVGAVHLLAGMAVQFVLLCRAGKWLDALFDVGSWWVLFAGLGLLAVKPEIGKWVAIAGVACIVLTQGRGKKGILGKLFGGVLKLYDLVSYMSDLLSYSRILALGLAAGVIAQVVNILGTLGGGTVMGYLIFIVVFLIGHLLNLVINVLGTFVHTSRLQYIEFFNKFFVDGGRPFRPALPTEDYSVGETVVSAVPNKQ